MDVDPVSPEAAQATTMLRQLEQAADEAATAPPYVPTPVPPHADSGKRRVRHRALRCRRVAVCPRVGAPLNGPIIIISIDTLRRIICRRMDTRRSGRRRSTCSPPTASSSSARIPPRRNPPGAHGAADRATALETGVRDDVGGVVRRGERLLPRLLRERGYLDRGDRLGVTAREKPGINQGFDFFDDDMPVNSGGANRVAPASDGGESEQIAEHWLDTIGTSRAFLFLHLYEPHKPYAPPARFAEYEPYDGEIAYADEIVGRLVKYLKTHQLYDRSTVILLADHGEGLGDHGEKEHGLFLYDETIRVPLIISRSTVRR